MKRIVFYFRTNLLTKTRRAEVGIYVRRNTKCTNSVIRESVLHRVIIASVRNASVQDDRGGTAVRLKLTDTVQFSHPERVPIDGSGVVVQSGTARNAAGLPLAVEFARRVARRGATVPRRVPGFAAQTVAFGPSVKIKKKQRNIYSNDDNG